MNIREKIPAELPEVNERIPGGIPNAITEQNAGEILNRILEESLEKLPKKSIS